MIGKIAKNYLIDTIVERLGSDWVDLYTKKLDDDYRGFLVSVLSEVVESQKDLRKVRSYYKTFKFNMTKKNWLKSIKASLTKKGSKSKELVLEIKLVSQMVDTYGNDWLQEHYNVPSLEELIDQRLKAITDWVEDENAKLIDYRYIEEKTNTQIQNVLTIDAVMCITKTALEEFNGDLNSIVKEVDDLQNSYALPGKSHEAKLSTPEVLPNGEYKVDEYEVPGELTIQTIIRNDPNNNALNFSAIKSLSPKDFEIFNYVMSRRDLDFVKNSKVTLDIGDIVKAVYNSRGRNAYNQVKQRLTKLKQLTFHIYNKNGDEVFFSLFSEVTIKNNEYGGSQAEIILPQIIHQKYINNQVTRVYRDKIKNFRLDLSESMVFALQKERFSRMKDGLSDQLFSYHYMFFTRCLRFPYRNMNKNMKLIEESLEEIKANQVTVSDYKKVGDTFYIAFIPVSESEAEDLIQDKTDEPIPLFL